MTYIMSCVWLDYMVKYFQCKNCLGSSLKTKKWVAFFPPVKFFGFFGLGWCDPPFFFFCLSLSL